MNKVFKHVYIHKRKFLKVLLFVSIGLIFGTVYALIEKGLLGDLHYYPATNNPYDFYENSLSTIIQSGLFGMIMGVIEVFFMDRLLMKMSFGYKFLIKTLIYGTTILMSVAFFSMVSSSILLQVSLFDPIVYGNLGVFFTNIGFWSIMIYIGAIFTGAIFVSELSDHMGPGVFKNFILGKYHKPHEEKLIFMFVDMKSSTAVAEKLGHVLYFRLLNEYYADITKAIIETRGEIDQYVGDEIVITWKLKTGLPQNNCLRCFFLCKSIININSDKYIKRYGLVPEFKIGLHYGQVTAGQIGVIKKEIIYSGDVLNTTSRIQNLCNTYGVDNLISSSLVEKIVPSEEYNFKEIGICQLRGREENVKLFTICNS